MTCKSFPQFSIFRVWTRFHCLATFSSSATRINMKSYISKKKPIYLHPSRVYALFLFCLNAMSATNCAEFASKRINLIRIWISNQTAFNQHGLEGDMYRIKAGNTRQCHVHSLLPLSREISPGSREIKRDECILTHTFVISCHNWSVTQHDDEYFDRKMSVKNITKEKNNRNLHLTTTCPQYAGRVEKRDGLRELVECMRLAVISCWQKWGSHHFHGNCISERAKETKLLDT